MEAYTLAAGGAKISVPASSIVTQQVPAAIFVPSFSDAKMKVIVFPSLAPGAKIAFRYRVSQKTPLFPGHFSVLHSFSALAAWKDVRIRVSAPLDYPLVVQAIDMAGGRLQDENGRARWEWAARVEHPKRPDPGSVAPLDFSPRLIISGFPDYAILAAAYEARAKDMARVTPGIQALADELTAGLTDEREQVAVLYGWVNRNIRYVALTLGVGSVVPHEAESIRSNRYGDCKDHVTLLQALLAAKKIDSSAALINLGVSSWMPEVAAAQNFNHVIVYVPSLDLYLDSTAPFVPFGLLPMGAFDKTVLVTKFGKLARTPRGTGLAGRNPGCRCE